MSGNNADAEAGYQRWRANIPFTDEQIAVALDQEADAAPNEWIAGRRRFSARLVRKGRVSRKAYCDALPRLVTQCSVPECGKVALYRYGAQGRCRTHKHLVTTGAAGRIEQHNKKSDAITAIRGKADTAKREIDRLLHSRRRVSGKRF